MSENIGATMEYRLKITTGEEITLTSWGKPYSDEFYTQWVEILKKTPQYENLTIEIESRALT